MEAIVRGGNSSRGKYSGVIVQGELHRGGNCPGGIFPGGNYSVDCPEGNFMS